MVEQAILLVLGACSAGYFCWTVSRRLLPLSRAHGALPTDRLGERSGRLVKEVLLQSRVIRDRPWAGLLHALVMWGFLAFAWVSLRHITEGFTGLEAVVHESTWYDAFAGVWAALVLVGIVGLSVRRFLLRPAALGDFSTGSAAVALLIVVLMASYLSGWRAFEPGSEAWRANWWLHTLALFAMLWVIPKSKHLHLLLGPPAVFFRRGDTTSPMRPLRADDDDDFGMLHFSDLSRKDVLDVNACVECGRCTDVCPANISGGSLSPKHVILAMQQGLLASSGAGEGRIAGTPSEIAEGKAWVAEDDLYQCYTCGACEQACPVGIEHVGAKILDLRRGLVSEGRTHHDKLPALFSTMERSPHNAWGASRQVRDKLITDEAFPVFDGSQEWLLWLGCGCNYDPHGQDVARSLQVVFNAAGVSWGVLARETCCGEPARRAGNEYLYMELSEKAIETLANSGAKKIVTADPHCCRMLDVDFRDNPAYAALEVEVFHHTELLAELAQSMGLQPEDQQATYHDPCYLARGRGVVKAPRDALELAGVELTEMKRRGTDGFCCGAGGAQLYLADDKAAPDRPRVNHLRFAEALETGCTTVAVACPYCAIMLKDAAGQAGRTDVQVVDVAELLASRAASSSRREDA